MNTSISAKAISTVPQKEALMARLVPNVLALLITLPALAQVAAKKLPVPDVAAQAKAEKFIKDLFKEDYAKKKPAEMLAFAGTLLEQARETKEDAAARFILFREARDLAAQAGDVAHALKTVDEIAKEFAVNGPAMKASALDTASNALTTPAAAKAFVEITMAVVDEALASDDFDITIGLLKIAQTAAQRSKSIPLVTTVQAKGKAVEDIRKDFQGFQKAKEKFAGDPKNPEANLTMGKYLCFVKETGKMDSR